MGVVRDRYLTGKYLEDNPDWDVCDAKWKAERVRDLLVRNGVRFQRLCEVGCGSAMVLLHLRKMFPKVEFFGFDIAPSAESFWEEPRKAGVNLQVGDFVAIDSLQYDVMLLLDVLEHVENPHEFLECVKTRAEYIVLHFPLDLSAWSVLREAPLLHVRRKVGHIHYFTKNIALELLQECGLSVLDWRYTGAAFSSPKAGWKNHIARWPRKLVYFLNKDVGVRLLGGETLMVLAST